MADVEFKGALISGISKCGGILATKLPDKSIGIMQKTKVRTYIRSMTKSDLGRVGEILFNAFNGEALKYGYTPKMEGSQEGASWAWALLRHGPSESLVAEVENRAIGICCLNPRGNHGGIGPVAVDPSYQGHGIGRQLMSALLKKAEGLQSVRLFQEAFNPASFSLYYSLNFMPVADMLDVLLATAHSKGKGLSSEVTELTLKDLDALYAYDLPRGKLDRRTDFAYYVQWGKVFVYRHQSQIHGFLACLPGSKSVQLGPLVAEGEKEAACLFQHAVTVFDGRPCQTRVMARDRLLVRALQGMGFKLYCLNVLMVRGSWQPGRYIEAFGRFPEGV